MSNGANKHENGRSLRKLEKQKERPRPKRTKVWEPQGMMKMSLFGDRKSVALASGVYRCEHRLRKKETINTVALLASSAHERRATVTRPRLHWERTSGANRHVKSNSIVSSKKPTNTGPIAQLSTHPARGSTSYALTRWSPRRCHRPPILRTVRLWSRPRLLCWLRQSVRNVRIVLLRRRNGRVVLALSFRIAWTQKTPPVRPPARNRFNRVPGSESEWVGTQTWASPSIST